MRFQTADQTRARFASAPRLSVLVLVLGLTALAGCGGSSNGSSSSASTPASPATQSSSAATSSTPTGASQTLSLAANTEGQLKYDKSSLSAQAGKVSIAFTNTASLPHNVTVASSSGAVVGATPTFQGGSKTVTLNLKPGAYKFYCSVPGHRAGGMEGTLTVQ
jgi:plastocyanin